MHELIKRRECAEATLAHYTGTPFQWGKADCLRMVAWHARKMGCGFSLVKAGSYSNPLGAVRALKRAGFETLEAAMDSRFERIAPAMALVGDVIALPTDEALCALAIHMDANAVLHTLNGGFAISRPLSVLYAWRLPVKLKGASHG